jgi:hypothetical protein
MAKTSPSSGADGSSQPHATFVTTLSSQHSHLSAEERIQTLMLSVLSGQVSISDVDPASLPALITALKEDRDDKICHRKPEEAEASDGLSACPVSATTK